jgi:hypothetical protein
VIELFYSVCGGPAGTSESEYDYFGLLSLKSLLMARAQAANNDLPGWPRPRRRFRVHVMTDIVLPRDTALDANSTANGGLDTSSGVVDTKRVFGYTEVNREVELALRHEPDVAVTFHDVQLLEGAAQRLGARQAGLVPQTFFKTCAASRLKLPFLMREWGLRRALYLDYDTVLQCDLSQLWAEFERFRPRGAAADAAPAAAATAAKAAPAAPGPFFGFAAVDPRPLRTVPAQSNGKDTYKLWNISRHPVVGGINSGVMLLDVEGLDLDECVCSQPSCGCHNRRSTLAPLRSRRTLTARTRARTHARLLPAATGTWSSLKFAATSTSSPRARAASSSATGPTRRPSRSATRT